MDGKDNESRFSSLLKPIRELADNWNIDVAAELEEYLEDLESVVISFNGGKSNLNFAEAALMIQGSAVVYSKKVEFLYNLVYETLELLSKQKKQKSEGSKEKASNRIILDDPVMVIDPSILGEHGNIDLKPDEKEIQRRIAMSNNFKRYSILRLYDSNMGIINSSINKDSKDRSFFLSRCSVAPTGQFTIGRASNTSLLLPSSHLASVMHNPTEPPSIVEGNANHQSSLFDDDLQPPAEQQPPTESVPPPPPAASIEPSKVAESRVYDDNDGDFEMPDMEPDSEPHQEPKHIDSVWKLVDPFDEKSNQSIPYSRGNVILKKDTVLKKLEGYQRLSSNTNRIQVKGDTDELLYDYPKEELYVFNRFQSSIKEFLKKQLAIHKPKQSREKRVIHYEPPESDLDGDGLMDIGGNDYDDNDILTANIENEEETQLMLESSRLNISYIENDSTKQFRDLLNTTVFDPLQINETDGKSRIETVEQVDTYEDLCRQHMEIFMRGVEQFTRETKLVKRVNEWENKIVPILEEQDKHEDFDLHKNREVIMSELKDIKEEVVPVAELASERQPYEVSRMFVSLLQMANDGNIKIQSSGECNDMEIKLLNESIPSVER